MTETVFDSMLVGEVEGMLREKKWEHAAERLVSREVGYDDQVFEDVEYMLRSCGAWSYLESVWKRVCRYMADYESMYGVDAGKRRKLAYFRQEAGSVYPESTVGKFLNEYGVLHGFVNRALHKRFLPDGSWISHGVRFGG